jgi:hypothetical protein
VYTPARIVDFILDVGGYKANEELETVTVLDPACGAGIFLERAVNVLHAHLVARGRARHLAAAVEANLWGVDIDAGACAIARSAVRNRVAALSGRPLPGAFFAANIVEADFLFGPEVEQLRPIRGAGIAHIVGNPPYVPTTRLAAAYKERLRRAFSSAAGRIDLYSVFIERALKLLRPSGRLSVITPDKFLTSYSARSLRSLILRTSAIRAIARFSSHAIFEGAATVPCVTVLEKGARAAQIRVLTCGYRGDSGRVEAIEVRTLPQAALTQAAWSTVPQRTAELIARLRSGHHTLSDLTVRISAGPATGRDNLFLLPRGRTDDVERELLRPAIRGRDLMAYRTVDPGLDLIVPYTFEKSGISKPIRLADFPRAAHYFKQRKEELMSRHCVRVWQKEWFTFHDEPGLDLATVRKILVPDVANSNRFAIDDGTYFPLHSVYYILAKQDVDLSYVVAVLNSSISAFIIRTEAPVVKDGFYRYRQQFLMTLPVPFAPRRTRAEVLAAAAAGDHARVDRLIQRVFGIEDSAYATIEAKLSDRIAA